MVTACLIATTLIRDVTEESLESPVSDTLEHFDSIDGLSEDEAYLQGMYSPALVASTVTTSASGEYKTILQLVGVLSHGRHAKRLADRAIDTMQDVQNLRKAIYE